MPIAGFVNAGRIVTGGVGSFIDIPLLILFQLIQTPQRFVLHSFENTLFETLVKCFSVGGKAFSSIFRKHKTVDSCTILHYSISRKSREVTKLLASFEVVGSYMLWLLSQSFLSHEIRQLLTCTFKLT